MFTDLFWKISFLFLIWIPAAFSQESQIEGRVVEMGTQLPMGGLRIFLLPLKKVTETDSKGQFKLEISPEELDSLEPETPLTWIINSPGFQKLELNEPQEDFLGKPSRVFRLSREKFGALLETTVKDKNKSRDPTRKSLSQRDFLQIPGSGGDPVKAAQNLPGVNRAPGFSSQVVIQGSEPEDTRYSLEGHEIPLMFHAGGFYSIGFPEAVEEVEILTAGYAADSGRALGGKLNLKFRDLDQLPFFKGLAYVDLLNSGLLIESPVGEKGSFLLAGRQSYIGFALKAFLPENDAFDLTVAPSFQDVLGIYQYQVSPTSNFRLLSIYSNDVVEFLLSRPLAVDPSVRGEFKTQTQFYRFIPIWTQRLDEKNSYNFSVGLGEDEISFRGNTNRFILDIKSLTTRGEWTHGWSSFQATRLGFDNRYSGTNFDIALSGAQGGGNSNSTETVTIGGYQEQSELGLYLTHEAKLDVLTVEPSLRLDSFRPSNENYLSPRLTLGLPLTEIQKLRLSGGVYYQPPLPQNTSPEFGNPNLKSSKSNAFALGLESNFKANSSFGWTLDNEFFYKNLSNLAVETLDSTRFTNSGKGYATGWQSSLKYLVSVFDFGINYTFSVSKRRDSATAPLYPSSFDQTHNLGLIAGVELRENWRVSSRFRYVTGNPYTPIVSAYYDSDRDSYLAVQGETFSRRFKGFSQLDLRIDRRFVFETWILSVYLDLQNLLNRKNEEQINYSYDFSQSAPVTGLPILGTLGIKGEF